MYEKPVKDKKYMLIADVSHGKGFDFSAFQIIDVTQMPYNQVCIFRDNMTTPGDYASVIQQFGKLYNEALVLVEINGLICRKAEKIDERWVLTEKPREIWQLQTSFESITIPVNQRPHGCGSDLC